ncbi:hypothetical protein Naga_100001g5 [Nannochloropsis gaditana]|uniref:Uncharacterized protein n=1 Tax=Nannochloropsis gaditana TaxID=72520 RepID=W7TI30_9STRA|nr:hypothetical protein Naga_100001g5 [Nannochloropsis gaditana]
MFFKNQPSSSPAYRMAAWGVAIVGLVAWTYWDQKKETDTRFTSEEAAKWNERVKGKTKARAAQPPTDGGKPSAP